jgi:hypothetical protein
MRRASQNFFSPVLPHSSFISATFFSLLPSLLFEPSMPSHRGKSRHAKLGPRFSEAAQAANNQSCSFSLGPEEILGHPQYYLGGPAGVEENRALPALPYVRSYLPPLIFSSHVPALGLYRSPPLHSSTLRTTSQASLSFIYFSPAPHGRSVVPRMVDRL